MQVESHLTELRRRIDCFLLCRYTFTDNVGSAIAACTRDGMASLVCRRYQNVSRTCAARDHSNERRRERMEAPERCTSLFRRVPLEGRKAHPVGISSNRNSTLRRRSRHLEHISIRNGGWRQSIISFEPSHGDFCLPAGPLDESRLAYRRREMSHTGLRLSKSGGESMI